MRNKKQVIAEISTLKDLKTIIESYEEIAAMRMRKVKKSVLQSRDFLSGLSDIYQRVVYTYRTLLESKASKKKNNMSGILQTNGKTLDILISSNTGLYGDIIKNTFDLFLANTRANKHDIAIIGRIGKILYDNAPDKKDYAYYQIDDTDTASDKIQSILEHILPYSNIIAYHGIFNSMLNQKAIKTFITGKALGEASGTLGEIEEHIKELKCIIEPSVEEVTLFFEKQILESIFVQTMYESSLAKYASRMVSLDVANENINQSLKKTNFAKLKIRYFIENTTQLERNSGVLLWK